MFLFIFFFFQAEDGIRDLYVTGVQTCALPISRRAKGLLSETSIPKGAVRSGQRARSLRVREPAFYFAMQMFFGSVKNSAFPKPPSSRFGAPRATAQQAPRLSSVSLSCDTNILGLGEEM